jgi:rubrerythrin
MMMSDLTTDEERLAVALATEKDGGEFYQETAANMADPFSRGVFETLANEEKKHVQFIEAGLASMKSGGAMAEVNGMELQELKSDIQTSYRQAAGDPGAGVKMDDAHVWAYDRAIELETKVIALYSVYAEESRDPEVREFFKKLSDYEHYHRQLLEGSKDYVESPGDYFMSREDPMTT